MNECSEPLAIIIPLGVVASMFFGVLSTRSIPLIMATVLALSIIAGLILSAFGGVAYYEIAPPQAMEFCEVQPLIFGGTAIGFVVMSLGFNSPTKTLLRIGFLIVMASVVTYAVMTA